MTEYLCDNDPDSGRVLRLALVGCGAHSEAAHADPLARYVAAHPGTVALVGACDRDRRRAVHFCANYGFARAYDDMDVMLERERPDVVVCVLPVEQIAPVGIGLFRRRMPCVLEKPPGTMMAQVAALADAARATGTPHMVSVNRRFSPFLNRALGWAKAAGPLRYVRARMVRHARRDEDFVWETGVHVVDALRHIGGEWDVCDIRRIDPPVVSAPWFLVSLRFASGCAGSLEILPTAGVAEETYELFGEGFRAAATTMGGDGESARCWRDGKLAEELLADPGAPLCLRDGSYEELSAFVHCLRTGEPPRPTVADVAPSLALCEKIASQLREDR